VLIETPSSRLIDQHNYTFVADLKKINKLFV